MICGRAALLLCDVVTAVREGGEDDVVEVTMGAPVAVVGAPVSAGEGGSSSSSDSESLESGLSGPSSSSLGAALAVGSCRLICLGKTRTGDGRRS